MAPPRNRLFVALLAAVVSAAVPRSARSASVCINGPSVYGGDYDSAAVAAVIGLHPACVRLPFRQDVWSSITDATPHGTLGRSLLGTYDLLVGAYVDAGIAVYALIDAETAGIAADAPRTPAGLDAYDAAFVAVVDHFKDRIRTYEMDNEPNNWLRTDYPALDEASFAALIARVYTDVKLAHASDPCWQVQLISGALFAFDQGTGGSSSDASTYLANTYEAGIASAGWDAIRAESGTYPLDGIGYHFYFTVEPTAVTQARIATYLNSIWDVVTTYEGSGTPKRAWVSEFGWQSDDTPAGDSDQAREMDAAYQALELDSRVAMGMWFTYQDFASGGLQRWGVYRSSGFGDADARPSRDTFRAEATTFAPAHDARLSWGTLPATVATGATAMLSLAATNTGSMTWSDGWRLGAGPGCPITATANEVPWSSFPHGGYADSATDARVYLGADVTVAPASAHEFTWGVVAPTIPGTYHVVARMVQDGVAWFGQTADAVLTVVPGALDAGSAGDTGAPTADSGTHPDQDIDGSTTTPPRDTGCGCHAMQPSIDRDAARTLATMAVGALLAARARRRRRA